MGSMTFFGYILQNAVSDSKMKKKLDIFDDMKAPIKISLLLSISELETFSISELLSISELETFSLNSLEHRRCLILTRGSLLPGVGKMYSTTFLR